ncbi:hypothetical protein Ate01nite_65350 [Actinoplanes teichomyceticus]|nr:hypothetical protein Ate01nite_65350 [Actinoplanes teichomyceticus]
MTAGMSLALSAGVLPAVPATAAPSFSIVADVETRPSSRTGVRDCRESREPVVTRAPDGFLIDKRIVKAAWVHARGSDSRYYITYGEQVAVLPGGNEEFYSKMISVRVRACSFEGANGSSGRSAVRVSGTFVPYPE